jgi:hypothetical protein
MNTSLRASIIISDKYELPAWEHEMLQQLARENLIQGFTFITVPVKPVIKSPFVYRLFCKFENWWFRSLPDAFKIINAKEEYPGADFISASDNKTFATDFVYISCLADKKYIPGTKTTFGIWSLSFGNDKYKDAQPPAFWEVMNDEVVTGSSLQVQLTGKDKMITVLNGITNTVPYSVKNSLSCIAWKSSSFLAYRLKELVLLGTEQFFTKYKGLYPAENSVSTDIYKAPGNLSMFWLVIKNTYRYFLYKLKSKKRKGRFTLLYSLKQYTGENIDLTSFKAMALPDNVFWADPFVITKDQEHFIFFEEFLYSSSKAHISLITIDKEGYCAKPVIVLDKPYHLSYPFVFEWQDEYYMIPDTSGNKTVALYKVTQFPYQWEFVMNLLEDTVLIDSTLLYENDTWWLFGTTAANTFTSTNDQLLLYYSKDLFSQNWIPHPQNPIATDISKCRPGGKIFKINNNLFRPAQNNASRQYGYALSINKIVTLNETTYREEKVSEIIPGKENKLSAVHTFNFSDSLIVIDGIISK